MRFLLALLMVVIVSTARAEDKPNVVIIQAADLGINDISYHVQDYIQTRAIDSIMTNGITFGRNYSPSPENVPGRFAVLSGQYPQHHGIEANPLKENSPTPVNFWPKEAKTIGQYAKMADYRTGYFGDWEFGFDPGNNPWELGFDYYCGVQMRLHSYYPNPKGPPVGKIMEMPANTEVPSTSRTYVPEVLGDKISKFIENNKADPFFIYASFTNPAYARWVDAPQRYYTNDLKSQKISAPRKDHLAQVLALDKQVGVILAKLKKEGLLDNTIVVLVGTNGVPDDNYTMRLGRKAFRGGKATVYEGGLRTPFMMQWPAKWPKRMLFDHPTSTMDIVSTVMGAMGAKSNIWDGVDLGRYILNKNHRPSRAIHFRHLGQIGMIINDNKIIHSLMNGSVEVYDIGEDPYERNNVVNERRGFAKNALERCRVWNLKNQDIQWLPDGDKFAIDDRYQEFNALRR